MTYTSSNNTATWTLTNAAGCDSVAVLNLTINRADTSYVNITACDSYTWNNNTYTQSGAYSFIGSSATNNYSMSFDGTNSLIDLQNLGNNFASNSSKMSR